MFTHSEVWGADPAPVLMGVRPAAPARPRAIWTFHVWVRIWAAIVLLVVSSSLSAQSVYVQGRESAFTYYGPSDGLRNGLLKTETVEPSSPALCVTTTYDYDAYGNRSSAVTANCAGAPVAASFPSRTGSTTYALQSITVVGISVTVPAGTFPTTSTNALLQSESTVTDPRFGATVKLTGPNVLSTTWDVDDFGRRTREVRADGTSTISYHCFIAGRVSDVSANTPGCPVPASVEIPPDAVAFVHSEPRDVSGTPAGKNGPFNRVYSDRVGRQIRIVTEGFDGPAQYGGAARLIVRDTDFSPYGPQTVLTQPYFLDSGSSTAMGTAPAAGYGMTATQYDVLGRPTRVDVADPSGIQTNTPFGSRGSRTSSRTSMAYAGLLSATTNDRNQTRQEERNGEGKVVRVTDTLGAQIVYQHDAFGNLLTTKDALLNQVTVAYDKRGRKVSMSDPDTGVWGYCHDALGQLVAQQNSAMRGTSPPGTCPAAPNSGAVANPVGGWTTLAYDKLGRMTSRVEPEYVTTWAFDRYVDGSACVKGIGKLCEAATTNGINRKIGYDSLGRPVNVRTTVANGPSFAFALAYDAVHGRLSGQTYPTGLEVNYNYTARGFLGTLTLATAATVAPTGGGGTSLSPGSQLWRADSYNAWGRAEKQTYGNGVTGISAFEAATGRHVTATAGQGASTNVLNHAYAWNNLGQLVQRDDVNGDGASGAVSETFTYDGIGRVDRYVVAAPAIPTLQRVVTLQYNALGMLLYKSDVGNYSYAAQGPAAVRPHAVQAVDGAVSAAYGYDINGNVINATAGKYRVLGYTSFNLPDSNVGAQGPAANPKYTWTYDENHQRIKEIQVGPAGTRTTWNVHPDNQGGLGFESESSTASPTPSNRHYLSVGGVSLGVLASNGALPVLAPTQTIPPVISSITLAKVEYWHKDHLGSLVATTDHAGAVTARYAYDPFGKRRQTNGNYDAFGTLVVDWAPNSNGGTDRGYTGHEHLDDVGIVHMNGRLFDPLIGRFMQGDPLIQDPGNLQNFDRYAYCYNNPLSCTDPSGMSSSSVLRIAAAIVVAIVAPELLGTMFASVAAATGGTVFATVSCTAASSTVLTTLGSYTVAATSGFLAGAIATGSLKGGLQGALSAGLFYGAGDLINGRGLFAGSGGIEDRVAQVAVHGVVGCVTSEAGGGKCGPGALSAAFSKAVVVSDFTRDVAASGDKVVGTLVTAMAGGTASALGGGKFGNGALAGAYGYLFNYCSSGKCTSAFEQALYDWWPGYKAGTLLYNQTSGDGSWTGWEVLDAASIGLGAAGKGISAGLNGGANSVFWSGWGSKEQARLFGTTLEATPIGRGMDWLQSYGYGSRWAWDQASAVFASNASGTAQTVIRFNSPASTFHRVELPILQRNGVLIQPH